jgi:hypothetical protein
VATDCVFSLEIDRQSLASEKLVENTAVIDMFLSIEEDPTSKRLINDILAL